MSTWKPVDENTPRNKPILVRGGEYFHQSNPYSPDYSLGKNSDVVSVLGEDITGWIVTLNKASIINPTEWAEIPE